MHFIFSVRFHKIRKMQCAYFFVVGFCIIVLKIRPAFTDETVFNCTMTIGIPYSIPIEKQCDEVKDCDKCEDEQGCENSLFFQCAGTSDCLPFPGIKNRTCSFNRKPCQSFCDGIPDCKDSSDEIIDGFGFKCLLKRQILGIKSSQCVLPQEFLTRWNKTSNLPSFTVCAEDADRCFISTEAGPVLDTSKCWPCTDGTLIQRQQVCDGEINCPDLTDECLCFRNDSFVDCKTVNRTSFSAEKRRRCTSNDGSATFCNGIPECRNAEDECGCLDEPAFCKNITKHGSLILKGCDSTLDLRYLCNGQVDCFCREDEANCTDGADESLELCSKKIACGGKDSTQSFYKQFQCDFNANCDNSADEMDCSDHFYCDRTDISERYIRLYQVGDGKFDCKDFRDECSQDNDILSSPTHLIAWNVMVAWVWIMCLFSLFGNSAVIGNMAYDLASKMRRRYGHASDRILVGNKILVLNLALADFMMGIYLLLLGSYNAGFGDIYCKEKLEWLAGRRCQTLGVLANVSSQSSVLVMASMTAYRLYGIISPFKAKVIRCRYIAVSMIVMWIASLGVGSLPVMRSEMISGFRIDQPYITKNILTVHQLHMVVDRARSLSSASNLSNVAYNVDGNINDLPAEFCNIFPAACKNQEIRSIGYYGSDGVCLPRFYGSLDEPNATYTLTIMVFDSVAIVFMIIAYSVIYFETASAMQPAIGTPRNHNDKVHVDKRAKENDAIWGRIVRLIASNLVCWVPICITSFVSFAGVEIPSIMYGVTAAFLIPVNSAVNPWIYSNFLWETLLKVTRRCRGHIRKLYVTGSLQHRFKQATTTVEPLEANIELIAIRNISLDGGFSTRSFELGDVIEQRVVESTQL